MRFLSTMLWVSLSSTLTSCAMFEDGKSVTSAGNPDCIEPCQGGLLSAKDLVDSFNLKNVKAFALASAKNAAPSTYSEGQPGRNPSSQPPAAHNIPTDNQGKIVHAINSQGVANTANFSKKQSFTLFRNIFSTPKALIFTLSDYDRDSCTAIVMRKDNGKLFCLEGFAVDNNLSERRGTPPFQHSTDGNLVVLEGWDLIKNNGGGTSLLYRLDLSKSDKLIVETIYDKAGYPEQWAVNGDGDTLISASLGSGRELRLITTEGGLLPFGNSDYIQCLVNGVGKENHRFFYLQTGAQNPTLYQISKFKGSDKDSQFDRSIRLTASNEEIGFHFWGCDSFLSTESVLYYAMTMPDPDSAATHAENTWQGKAPIVALDISNEGKVRKYELEKVRKVQKIFKRSQTLIVLGSEELGSSIIYELDLATGNAREVVSARKYIISDMTQLNDEKFSFYGERTSDAAVVQATVDIKTNKVETTLIKLNDVRTIEALN